MTTGSCSHQPVFPALQRLVAFAAILTAWGSSAAEIETRTGPLLLGRDSLPQEGVPQGVLKGPIAFRSDVFAGTTRHYWLYVPAQYSAAEPAGLLVFQDGQRATNPNGSLRVPQVMENLIAAGDMPVSIGLFITPGNRSESYPNNLGMGNPNHRAQEYDALSDHYARMLIDELLPEIERDYRLTDDPTRRIIGGTSSGAICAFTVGWHRPDQFGKVLSFIGSYVSIGFRPEDDPVKLGGQDYPALIRRGAIRPLRIFLQDGSNDLDNEWGHWFLANQQMVAALDFANRKADKAGADGPRYATKAVWTEGAHSDEHAGALLPEAIRWLYASDRP